MTYIVNNSCRPIAYGLCCAQLLAYDLNRAQLLAYDLYRAQLLAIMAYIVHNF